MLLSLSYLPIAKEVLFSKEKKHYSISANSLQGSDAVYPFLCVGNLSFLDSCIYLPQWVSTGLGLIKLFQNQDTFSYSHLFVTDFFFKKKSVLYLFLLELLSHISF